MFLLSRNNPKSSIINALIIIKNLKDKNKVIINNRIIRKYWIYYNKWLNILIRSKNKKGA